MTFSIAGICTQTGRIGYAVTTSSVAVGARVGRIGPDCVVFSQARTDPRLHAPGIAEFGRTQNARRALDAMQAAGDHLHWRQVGVLSRFGDAVYSTGESCLPHAGGLVGENCLALGNFLASDHVLPGIVEGFATAGPDTSLAGRLLAGLQAGAAAGGERDRLQSAAVKVLGADDLFDVDLRVDKSTDPLSDLADLLRDWAPKADAYRIRALAPDDAPSSSEVEGTASPT